MTGNVTFEMEGLQRFSSELLGTLIGSGRGGDVRKFIEVESGLLAQDIAQSLGPKSEKSGAVPIEQDMNKYLTVKPAFENLEAEDRSEGTGDMDWLAAGPTVLSGIYKDDDQIKEGATGVAAIFRYEQKNLPDGRGPSYLAIGGGRGIQHVQRVNRIRVKKAAFRAALKILSLNLGLLKASFAYTASRLLSHRKTLPQFVMRHIASSAQGRAILNDSGMANNASPVMEFGSTSIGVESNPKIAARISEAVKNRRQVMSAKLKKIIKGYIYDWNTGRVFRSQQEIINADN